MFTRPWLWRPFETCWIFKNHVFNSVLCSCFILYLCVDNSLVTTTVGRATKDRYLILPGAVVLSAPPCPESLCSPPSSLFGQWASLQQERPERKALQYLMSRLGICWPRSNAIFDTPVSRSLHILLLWRVACYFAGRPLLKCSKTECLERGIK